MLALNAQLGLTRVWTNTAYECVWATTALLSAIASSAIQVWTGAMRYPAVATTRPRDVTSSMTHVWHGQHGGPSFATGAIGSSPAVTAWREIPYVTAVWWFPLSLGMAGRNDVMRAWEGAFAAAGLAVMRGWSEPADALGPVPSEVLDAPSVEIGPFSAYRTDGGHAAAQITVRQTGAAGGRQPCQGDLPMRRPRRTQFH